MSSVWEKGLCDLADEVRAHGSVPEQLLLPLTALLFLRWASVFEAEQEAIAAFDGKDFTSMLPGFLRWDELRSCKPHRLDEVFGAQVETPGHGNVVSANLGTALAELSAERAEPILPYLFRLVDSLPFETPRHMAEAEEALAGVIPNTARKAGWYAFEHYTPAPVCELMVGLIDPQPGDRIYDPCFGVGGLLVAAARRLRDACRRLPPRTWVDLGRNTFYGVEISSRAHFVGLTRLLLLGFHRPGLQIGDTLHRPPYGGQDKFSCVLAVPPWGMRIERNRSSVQEHFRFRTPDALGLFMQHIAASLRPNGRAVVAVPDGFLFKAGGERQIRRMLLREFCVEGVVGLPEKSFAPYTMVGGNLLLFRKCDPGERVRFLRVPGLAGVGSGSDDPVSPEAAAVTPAAVAEKFRQGKVNAILWETPVEKLAKRDWDLQVRRSGDDELERFLRALQEIDEEMPQLPLADTAEVLNGVSYSRETTTEKRSASVHPLLRVADIADNKVRRPGLHLTAEGAVRIDTERALIRPGDVLLTSSGTIGKTAVADADSAGAVPGKSIIRLRPDPQTILPAFLEGLLCSSCYRKWLRGRARGATIQHLSVRVLRELPVPVPPIAVQAAVVNRWQSEGGDIARTLLAFLTDVAPHPLIGWIENSIEVENTIRLSNVRDRDRRLGVMDQIANAILQATNTRMRPDDDDLPGELRSWRRFIRLTAQDLAGIDRVPAGPARYSLVSAAHDRLSLCQEVVQGAELPVCKRAAEFSERLAAMVRTERDELLSNTRLSARFDPECLPTGEAAEVILRLRNDGVLPLRSVTVTTRPDMGGASGQYLPDGASLDIPLQVAPQTSPGRLDVLAEWSCTRLDGENVVGEISLSLRIVSTRDQVRSGEIVPSPYNGQDPVENGQMFFGREAARRRITDQLDKTSPAGVIFLLGNRRMGKTSILKRLQAGEWVDDHLCVYCSFQGASDLRTASLYRHMTSMIGQQAFATGVEIWYPGAAPGPGVKPFKKEFKDSLAAVFATGDPLAAFEVYLEHILEQLPGRRLLLMLDEFDTVQEGIESGVTDSIFPKNLRHLVHSYRGLSLMLVGSPQVRSVRNTYWSPLFGLGETVTVGPLEREEAGRLATEPVPHLTHVPEAVDLIVDLCACRANLVQKLCDQIVCLARQEETQVVTVDMVNKAAHDITVDNEHFATLWDEDCETERQRFVLCLCARESAGETVTYGEIETCLEDSSVGIEGVGLERDIEHLCDAEILFRDPSSTEGAYRIAVPLMLSWLRNRDFDVQQRKAVRESREEGFK